jgi:hypothetical protein
MEMSDQCHTALNGAHFTQIWMGITPSLGMACKVFHVFPGNKLPNFSAAYPVLLSKFSTIFLPSLF